MAYKIVEIEGVGEAYAKKLEEAGVKTTEICLKKPPRKKDAKNSRKKPG